MTTSNGDRNHDPSISSDTGLPENYTGGDIWGRVILEPAEANALLSAIAGLLDPGSPAAQHLRYVGAELTNPEAHPPATTARRTTATTSSTST
jgi:hypothetical protein